MAVSDKVAYGSVERVFQAFAPSQTTRRSSRGCCSRFLTNIISGTYRCLASRLAQRGIEVWFRLRNALFCRMYNLLVRIAGPQRVGVHRLERLLPKLPLPDQVRVLLEFERNVLLVLPEGERRDRFIAALRELRTTRMQHLDRVLRVIALREPNYHEQFWLRKGYLECRGPSYDTTHWTSAGMCYHVEFMVPERSHGPAESVVPSAARAAYFVAGMLDFQHRLSSGGVIHSLPRVWVRESWKSMETLFGTCRIPAAECDTLSSTPHRRYIAVMYGSEIFTLPVFQKNGDPLTRDEIYTGFLQIMRSKGVRDGESSVGLFSSLPRAEWAVVHQQMVESSVTNRNSFEALQRALAVVVLDTERNPRNFAERAWMANYQGPRFYDHQLQWVFFADGTVAMTHDHTASDAVAVTRAYEDVAIQEIRAAKAHGGLGDGVMRLPAPKEVGVADYYAPHHLTWELTASQERRLRDAAEAREAVAKGTHYRQLILPWGKDAIKGKKVSPDSFVQVVLQLAYRRTFGRVDGVYETGSTGAYQHGRTATVRSTTSETKKFADELIRLEDTASEWGHLTGNAIAAINDHTRVRKVAESGGSPDRYLLALLAVAERLGMRREAELLQEVVAIGCDFPLSTSQTPSMYTAGLAFPPPSNIGCSYHNYPGSIHFYVTGRDAGAAEAMVENIRKYADVLLRLLPMTLS